LRGDRTQHAARFQPGNDLFGPLGVDRLAERLAADILARDLIELGASQPARGAARRAIAIAPCPRRSGMGWK
jgi:hypothetical protein